MRTRIPVVLAVLAAPLLAACHSLHAPADPLSDAPEVWPTFRRPIQNVASYDEALRAWRNADDLNAWIGEKFEYDAARAILLSETQRVRNARLPIHDPGEFFAQPRGVCVDLSRFAVETLRITDPQAKPAYVMIEFDPLLISGNTLRRHWIASFERAGQRYFFADSKRPGHIAGPYPSTQSFIEDYERYRGRRIVAFREMDSYQRTQRKLAAPRVSTPCADHRCTRTPPQS